MTDTKKKTSQKATKSYKNNQPTSSAKVNAKSSKAKTSNKSLASSGTSSSAQSKQTKNSQASGNAQNKNSKANTSNNKAKDNSNNDDSLQITEHSPQQQKGIMFTQVWSGAITIIAGLILVALANFGVLSSTLNLDLLGAIGLVIMYLVLQVIVGLIIANMYNLKLHDVLFKFHI